MKIENITTSFSVRNLTEKDVPQLLKLCRGNTRYYGYAKCQPDPHSLASVLTELPPGKTMQDKYFLGFFKDQCLVALLDLVADYPTPGTAFIGWFMVDVSRQGTGVGTQIVCELLDFLKRERFRLVRLACIEANREGAGFWRKNGFHPTGERVETPENPLILYQLSLEDSVPDIDKKQI